TGIDVDDSYAFLAGFVQTVQAAGCHVFVIHARKAWLQGLSPRENRDIPPLHYDTVYRIKQDFPALTVIINGGIRTVAESETHLAVVDGVMLGREVYGNPWWLHEIEQTVFHETRTITRETVIQQYLPYVEQQLSK